MTTLTINPAEEGPRRSSRVPGAQSARAGILAAERSAARFAARKVAADRAVVTDADWRQITNYLKDAS